MSADRNPHAEQMADESMIRTLAAQVSAIWPQEEPLFGRYGLRPDCHIADIGCGSGEITSRLALMYARADVIGIDILAAMPFLDRACTSSRAMLSSCALRRSSSILWCAAT